MSSAAKTGKGMAARQRSKPDGGREVQQRGAEAQRSGMRPMAAWRRYGEPGRPISATETRDATLAAGLYPPALYSIISVLYAALWAMATFSAAFFMSGRSAAENAFFVCIGFLFFLGGDRFVARRFDRAASEGSLKIPGFCIFPFILLCILLILVYIESSMGGVLRILCGIILSDI
jgi:hypothetical protein